MDGFALRAADTPGRLPVVARIAAGVPAPRALAPGEAMGIATGGVVPDGADAVIPIEYVVESDNEMEIDEAVAEGDNVRPRGGDVAAGAVVVAARCAARARTDRRACRCRSARGVVVRAPPARRGARDRDGAAAGRASRSGPGEVYEANGVLLAAALASAGADVEVCRPSPTTRRHIATALERGLEADVLVTSGGVSVGPHDLVRRDPAASSASRRCSGASPSSPASRSRSACAGRTLVFGLPGNPVSSLVGFELFVRPAVLALQGAADPWPAFRRRHGCATAGAPQCPARRASAGALAHSETTVSCSSPSPARSRT